MKEDKILQMAFQSERWQYAIQKGLDKDINKATLYQLTTPEARALMYQKIRDGKYRIMPPHTALIPKDNGEFRTVYINEPADRILLSIANDLLFELTPEMVHPCCTSYQKGIGCGRVVQNISRQISFAKGRIGGFKSDLSKYFDTVLLSYIDWAFNQVELRHGHSALIDVLRAYYHCNLYFDTDGSLSEKYQSLKQGCSVASWLADVVLYHIDERLSRLRGVYCRYSDDAIFVGEDWQEAKRIMEEELAKMQMKLNPKKVEFLDADHWFKFLGFSIKGSSISLSSTRIKTFQKEIEKRTVKKRDVTLQKAINSVNRYLYKGYEGHSWSTQVLPIINAEEDVQTLNTFVMDCLRAVKTGKRKIGGTGFAEQGCHIQLPAIARIRDHGGYTRDHRFRYAGNIIHLKTRAKTSQLCTDINHPQHREAYLKRVPFSIQSFNAGASKADIRLYGTRTRSGHITHLQPCAATLEKPAPRELHPVRTRKEETFTPDCLHQQIFTGSISRYRSVSQNGLRSFTYRNATHPQSVSPFYSKKTSVKDIPTTIKSLPLYSQSLHSQPEEA